MRRTGWLAVAGVYLVGSVLCGCGSGSSSSPCDGVDCGLHGACVELNAAAACYCDAGYHAEDLTCVEDGTEDPCEGVDCGPHGACVDRQGAPACTCEAGYHPEGLTCVENSTEDPCEGVDCGAHGTCVDNGGAPACLCDAGYHAEGLTCVEDTTEDPCEGVDCGAHGSCVDSGGAPACLCDAGYHAEGLTCVEDQQDGSPIILSFSANNTTMNRQRQLVLTAIVTDPDGIDDLIGGQLTDPDGSGTYGAFATAATEGSYSIELTWDEIQQVRSIDTPSGGADRVFRATFYDQSGHDASDTLTIHLECASDPDLAVCEGDCTDLEVDHDHCGACFNQVPYTHGICVNGQFACPAGRDLCGNDCVDLTDDDLHCGACGHACQDAAPGDTYSYRCDDGACFFMIDFFTRATCDDHCASGGLTCPADNNYLSCRDTSVSGSHIAACVYYDECGTDESEWYSCDEMPDLHDTWCGDFQFMTCACTE